MTIKPSPLELKDFSLTNVECHFIPPEPNADILSLFQEYEIDINFGSRKVNVDGLYTIYIKAEINFQRPDSSAKKGYEMFIECMGIFSITDTEMPNEEKMSLLSNSGLVMTLNFLRTKLADVTSQFPMGKYLLPSIDLKDLIEKKKTLLAKAKENKAKK